MTKERRTITDVSGAGMSALILRVRLFFSSYAPLFAILAVRFQKAWLEIALAACAAAGVVTLWLAIRAMHHIEPSPHTVLEVSEQGAEVAGYLATYLLPFVTVPDPSARDLTAYGLFLLVVAVVYVQSRMLQINPLLYVLGYRVAAVRTSDGWSGYLLGRSLPRPGDTLLASRLDETLALARHGWQSSGPPINSQSSPSTRL